MASSKTKDTKNEETESARPPKLYRFELSRTRLFLYSCGLILSLCWMFTFGVLIGRGVPLVEMKDTSLKAEFFRFLGLGQEVAPPPENVADTWDTQKVLQSLSYYKNLTQRDASAALALSPSASGAGGAAPVPVDPSNAPPAAQPPKPALKETSNQNQKAKVSAPVSREPKLPEPEKPPAKAAVQAAVPPPGASEHFSLLISSLRDADSAKRLLEQLRAKGYTPRIEIIDLQAGGKWNRVLLGSFRSRDEALRFAADFNKKERMEGLVIRETQ